MSIETRHSGPLSTAAFGRKVAGELYLRYRRRMAWFRAVRSVEGRLLWSVVCDVDRASVIEVGAGSSIGHGTILSLQSGPMGPGSLRIGEDTWIGEYNNLHSDGAELRIGSHCLISQFVSLIATGHEYRDARVPIRDQGVSFARGLAVGDDVWIGAGASIMPGVTVGDGAVVASGALVMRNVPRYSIVAGMPAQVMGKRSNRP
jgi:carbonic anhydrase/acetyltransferase-like protein (isoleucine patch superfamily)